MATEKPPTETPDNLNDASITTSDQKPEPTDQEAFPDGGLRAWLVAAGSAGAFFCTLGYTNVFGIFQAYYMFNQMPERSADDIAWIGSVQAFLIFATGAVGGPLFDRFGAWLVRPAAVLYVFAIMMTSICTSYWQFMLAQGILTGLANGLLMFPALSAVPQWFNRNRGAAMGLAIAGSSLGAVIFPIVLSNLLTKTDIGFGWSVRITGFIMLPFLTFAALSIRSRLPPRRTRFLLWSSFREPMYVLLIASMFFGMIGMFVPMFLLPTYAITKGMDESLATYLVAMINGASIFGRVIPGVLGDKFGRINTLIGASVATSIIIFCWPEAETNASIIAVATLFGFTSGAIISGGSVAITLCPDDPKNIGTYMGVGMALASFAALVGPPVSGAMMDRYGRFEEVTYFGGAMTMFGGVMAAVAKSKSPQGLFGKT
ncbi:major facilitator superfamily domain-containing protein [Ilyonectria robusta]|uniref:major facilitator superfamily domain-containing protein n=1 Tax=Ilyonectria robusta TaxID=1079257 RepID=UPI001E8E58D6|nr:major facilitator superfamily domain-containing protein [Ilyonectria robusta]KAH8688145.1 major facilitator superfamily domain-containing protein [Ilyonectria robusta]